MGQQVKYIATLAQDDYNQNYADGSSFFLLDDFIYRTGNVAAGIYQQMFDRLRAEMRQENRDEVVAFEPSVLSEQEVSLEKNGDHWMGKIENKAMSFLTDEQTSGYQIVRDAETGEEIERSNINEYWSLKYLPQTCRKFFIIEGGNIRIWNKTNSNTKKLQILYVPSVKLGDGESELPDGMVADVIAGVVNYMRAAANGTVIKKANDGNPNKILESEINKESLK